VPVPTVARETAPEPAPARRVPRRATGPSVTEVTDLARELTADLTRAAETNARLKSDLDAALAALRLAAEESGEQRADSARLAADLDKRGAELACRPRRYRASRSRADGALAQVARLSRELREEKARVTASAEEAQARARKSPRARSAPAPYCGAHVRVGERDEARKDLLAAAPSANASPKSCSPLMPTSTPRRKSRNALEEIHKALAEARARILGIR